MYCVKCGKENQEDAVFCNSCGIKIGAQNPVPVSAQNSSQQANNQAYMSMTSLTLKSMPPAKVNPESIAMFKVKRAGIAMEMDGEWGERVFFYTNSQEMRDDCNKIFVALQHTTNNMIMQFKSEGGPVVPIYRMKKVHANDWWKRLEIDIEGAGGQWFEYPTKDALYADYDILMNLMRSAQQQ